MFVFNIRINKNLIFKVVIVLLAILSLLVLCASVYKIFSKANEAVTVNDTISSPDVVNITSNNYTNILNTVYNNLDSYIGQNISFTRLRS